MRRIARRGFLSSKGAWNVLRLPKHIGRILPTALLCAACSALAAAPDRECGERVSLAGLISNPDAFHGKALWVVAHVTIDFENMTACPSEKETQTKSCLWLDIDDGPYKGDQDYARYQSKLFNPDFMRGKNLPAPEWLEKRSGIKVPFEAV